MRRFVEGLCPVEEGVGSFFLYLRKESVRSLRLLSQRASIQRKIDQVESRQFVFGLSWLPAVSNFCASSRSMYPFIVARGEADLFIAENGHESDAVWTTDFDYLGKGNPFRFSFLLGSRVHSGFCRRDSWLYIHCSSERGSRRPGGLRRRRVVLHRGRCCRVRAGSKDSCRARTRRLSRSVRDRQQ